jgi:cation diffusion facilitator CzcD-associated flavoprotein CzcO
VAEKVFTEIKIFEQRAEVGGLWNYTSTLIASDRHSIPQTSPRAANDRPVWNVRPSRSGKHRSGDAVPTFMSPVYEELETNIPRELMGFSDLDWPESCQLFPRHDSVLKYLKDYAHDVMHLIRFQMQVLDVRLEPDGSWRIRTREVSESHTTTIHEQIFDAVIVASGHFNVPYIPHVAGIEAWDRAYPGSILHSKFYRRPEDYTEKRVIVVGNSASGVDIASQVSTMCKLPLLQSQKSESFLQPDQSPTKVERPEIVEYIPDGRRVRFADGSIETDIDSVLYCTGYFYSFPFLDSLTPPVIRSGEYVESLYQHTFYRHHPTLSFVALNQKIVPFPVAEAQSAVIARVLSGRLTLPSYSEMDDWEQSTLQDTGGGRNFHVLKFPKDADNINMLHDWAMSADQGAGVHHELHKRRLSSSASNKERSRLRVGKQPPYWGEKEYWTRERFPKIKVRSGIQPLFETQRHQRMVVSDTDGVHADF